MAVARAPRVRALRLVDARGSHRAARTRDRGGGPTRRQAAAGRSRARWALHSRRRAKRCRCGLAHLRRRCRCARARVRRGRHQTRVVREPVGCARSSRRGTAVNQVGCKSGRARGGLHDVSSRAIFRPISAPASPSSSPGRRAAGRFNLSTATARWSAAHGNPPGVEWSRSPARRRRRAGRGRGRQRQRVHQELGVKSPNSSSRRRFQARGQHVRALLLHTAAILGTPDAACWCPRTGIPSGGARARFRGAGLGADPRTRHRARPLTAGAFARSRPDPADRRGAE